MGNVPSESHRRLAGSRFILGTSCEQLGGSLQPVCSIKQVRPLVGNLGHGVASCVPFTLVAELLAKTRSIQRPWSWC